MLLFFFFLSLFPAVAKPKPKSSSFFSSGLSSRIKGSSVFSSVSSKPPKPKAVFFLGLGRLRLQGSVSRSFFFFSLSSVLSAALVPDQSHVEPVFQLDPHVLTELPLVVSAALLPKLRSRDGPVSFSLISSKASNLLSVVPSRSVVSSALSFFFFLPTAPKDPQASSAPGSPAPSFLSSFLSSLSSPSPLPAPPPPVSPAPPF
ncbi:hypothetical protein F4679DRAFT_554195 [Xylaria curta]|nr:hypothetical protein F4679DRAFT_554195 [Xylaria curta]